MCKKFLTYALMILPMMLANCDSEYTTACAGFSKCQEDPPGTGQQTCSAAYGTKATDGCQTTTTTPLLGSNTYSCNACTPAVNIKPVVLSLQGGQTCPVTTTHSESFKTPGCWCYVPFVGDRCCFCGGGLCYITNTWTTTTYVPAPPYGNCP